MVDTLHSFRNTIIFDRNDSEYITRLRLKCLIAVTYIPNFSFKCHKVLGCVMIKRQFRCAHIQAKLVVTFIPPATISFW